MEQWVTCRRFSSVVPFPHMRALPVNSSKLAISWWTSSEVVILWSTSYEMQTICNDNCLCTEKVFQPICGPDNRTHFFSPCFAGCKADSLVQIVGQKNVCLIAVLVSILTEFVVRQQFKNCHCLFGSATEGYCPKECNQFAFYVTFLGIANLIGSLAKTGNTIISFRYL